MASLDSAGTSVGWRNGVLRLNALVILCVLVSANAAWSQEWYQDYQAGQKAYRSGDYASAERSFRAALTKRPEQGRNVRFVSQLRGKYVPEYYLALIYSKTGRWQQFREAEASLRASGLIVAGDPEFVELSAADATARANAAEAAKTATATPATGPEVPGPAEPPPNRTTEPSTTATVDGRRESAPPPVEPPIRNNETPNTGTTVSAASAAADAQRTFDEISGLMTRGQWPDAQARLQRAIQAFPSDPRFVGLLREARVRPLIESTRRAIDTLRFSDADELLKSVRTLESDSARVRALATALDERRRRTAATDVERAALGAYFRGDYQQAASVLGQMSNPTARAYFYMACSAAAIALLERDTSSPRLVNARQWLQAARAAGYDGSRDRPFISPRVLELLGGTAP